MTKAYIVHYCDDKFPHQDDEKWKEVVKEIKTIDPDKIIVLSSTEVDVEAIYGQLFDRLAKYLKRTNKIVNVITPHLDNVHIRPSVVCERTYGNVMAALPNFLCSSTKPYYWDFGSGSVPPYKQKYNFQYLYSCYNVRVAEHRYKMVDVLARENLIEKGMVTFHYPEKVEWKYYDGKKRSDEATYSKESHDHFRYPASFQKCFVDIVAETWHEPQKFHVTEKTLRSIAFFKPFLVLSCKGFYKDYLCKYFGLELYDEVFDYSFDNMDSLEDRIDGIADNIKKLENLNQDEISALYISLIPKLIRNKAKLVDILYDKNKIVPNAFKFMLTDTEVTLYGMTENSLFGYMYRMGWCNQYAIQRDVDINIDDTDEDLIIDDIKEEIKIMPITLPTPPDVIYYFDSNTEVNMSNLHQIKEVRPLRKILEKLVTEKVEVRYTTDYVDPGLYIVEVSKHTHQWTGHPTSYHTFNLLAEVPIHVINAVKEKKLRLVILSTVEGGNFEKDFWDGFKSLQDTMNNWGLPKFGLVIVSANLKAGEQYVNWCNKHEIEPAIEWIGGIENPLQGYGNINSTVCGVIAAEKESPKDFSSLNRAASLHRIDHMYTLANDQLLDNALVSGGQLNRINSDTSIMDEYPTFIECDITRYRTVLKTFYPRSIDLGDLETNNPSNYINFEIYNNAMLSVVTETWYDDPGLTFSEKSFRSISTGNPQIILGQPEITKYLSKYGYNLNFKGLDLSFDNEHDHKKRFAAFHETLRYWCSLPLEKKRHYVLNEWRDQLEENRKIHASNNYGKFITDDLINSSKKYFEMNL